MEIQGEDYKKKVTIFKSKQFKGARIKHLTIHFNKN